MGVFVHVCVRVSQYTVRVCIKYTWKSLYYPLFIYIVIHIAHTTYVFICVVCFFMCYMLDHTHTRHYTHVAKCLIYPFLIL